MNDPKWLKAVFQSIEGQEHEEEKRAAWEFAAKVAMSNGRGFVVRAYDSANDDFVWHFGSGHWPMLTDYRTQKRYTDDPFRERRDDIPLEEFVRYLNDWYFPRKHKIEAL